MVQRVLFDLVSDMAGTLSAKPQSSGIVRWGGHLKFELMEACDAKLRRARPEVSFHRNL